MKIALTSGRIGDSVNSVTIVLLFHNARLRALIIPSNPLFRKDDHAPAFVIENHLRDDVLVVNDRHTKWRRTGRFQNRMKHAVQVE